MSQRPLTLILLQKYRDTNGRRIVIQIGGVYTTFCPEEGILLRKYCGRNGRCIAILFKVLGSGVDSTLLRVSRYTFPNLSYRSRGEKMAEGIAAQAALWGVSRYTRRASLRWHRLSRLNGPLRIHLGDSSFTTTGADKSGRSTGEQKTGTGNQYPGK